MLFYLASAEGYKILKIKYQISKLSRADAFCTFLHFDLSFYTLLFAFFIDINRALPPKADQPQAEKCGRRVSHTGFRMDVEGGLALLDIKNTPFWETLVT